MVHENTYSLGLAYSIIASRDCSTECFFVCLSNGEIKMINISLYFTNYKAGVCLMNTVYQWSLNRYE